MKEEIYDLNEVETPKGKPWLCAVCGEMSTYMGERTGRMIQFCDKCGGATIITI